MSRQSSASRRLRQEEALVRRRNAEHEHRALWNGVSQYFRASEVQCAKHTDWASPQYFTDTENAQSRTLEAARRQQWLSDRRSRLARMLLDEARTFEKEIQCHPHPRPQALQQNAVQAMSLNELKYANLELKRRDEEKRSRHAELLLYHQWKAKQPQLREFERRQHGEFVRKAWSQQVAERREQERLRDLEQEAAHRQRLQQQEEEMRREQETLEIARNRAKELQEQLKQQVQELRDQEQVSEQLQRERAAAAQRQAELEEAMLQRKRAEDRRKQQELGLFLHHQYQLKLRRRAKEVQESLNEDRRLLAALLTNIAEEKARKDERRVQARRDMEHTQRMLEEQAEMERQREQQMEFLFHEEARKMWKEQEARWQSEQEARDRLMTQVLATLHQQVCEHLARNLEEQHAVLCSREELLAEVEAANQELEQTRQAQDRSKEECRQEIDRQVAEKGARRAEERRQEELATERQQEEMRLNEEKLVQELQRMDSVGYRPQSVGRRRILW